MTKVEYFIKNFILEFNVHDESYNESFNVKDFFLIF
jgi:hypothetical protein